MLSSGSYNSTLSIRLRYLARHLSDAWDITIIAPSADKYNDFKPDHSLKSEFARLVQPWQLVTRSFMLNLIPYLFSSLVSIIRARADAVIIYKPTPITVLGLVPKLLSHAAVVVDLDDLGAEVIRNEGRSRLTYGLVDWSERFCVRHANAVAVASTTLREHVRQLHPGKPILMLPNAVEPGEYHVVTEQRPRHGVYFFGALNRLDLIKDLLQAMPTVLDRVPDTRLTIIGGGTALDDAKSMCRELGIEAAVTCTGWQTDMLAVQNYTQFADVAVCYLPDIRTVRAASNMKVFQYMAMGTVPGGERRGRPARLRSGRQRRRGGAARQPRPALASTLVELMQDDEARVRMAKEARQLAGDEHSWRTRATALDAFLTETVPPPAPGAAR